ncbi:MAG: hypothetical protein K2W99_01300 [Chthoniobacterales bacterium]|nr:hypothetical protein [Chthoniobacterales bacterium]
MTFSFLELPCLRTIRSFLLLGALFFLIGGHWAVFQSVAWVQMVESYSHEGSFQKAVEKTFSGRHPCSLCKKISAERQKETKTSFPLEKKEAFSTFLVAAFLALTLPLFPKEFSYPSFLKNHYSPPVFPPLTRPPMGN